MGKFVVFFVTLETQWVTTKPEVDTTVDFRLHQNGCANLRAANTPFGPPDLHAADQNPRKVVGCAKLRYRSSTPPPPNRLHWVSGGSQRERRWSQGPGDVHMISAGGYVRGLAEPGSVHTPPPTTAHPPRGACYRTPLPCFSLWLLYWPS